MDYDKVLKLLDEVNEELSKETSTISKMNWKYDLHALIKKINDRRQYVK